MNKIDTQYNLWLEKAVDDPDLVEELRAIAGDEQAKADRFYKSLEFGTAGLRGVIGAGTNRMNIYTVGQATQGLADFLNKKYDNPSVAIAYDSRIKSDVFAKDSAAILAANSIKVYLFEELVPTPVLSFAVRELGCKSGIILTASHNPAEYNGYKCYDPDGYQMTDESARATLDEISKTDIFSDVKKVDFDCAVKDGKIEFLGEDMMNKFLSAVERQRINKDAPEKADLKIVYTPLNGTGNKPVREILRRIGCNNVKVVPQQELPDGNFPTCPYPNPEIEQAFEYAIKCTEDFDADLLLATDPDCDRVGIAVKDNGSYRLMSGNEVGAMLLEYILSCRKANGTLPENPVAVKSFVTTGIVFRIAEKYGCEVVNLLTGFKYIGECITNLEKKGEQDRFVLGFEESYGYLCGTHARDKDAVVASMMICEMAAYYKLQGKSLVQVMDEIYKEYGIYKHTVLSLKFEGESGMNHMAEIMSGLRAKTPESFAGLKVESVEDFDCLKKTNLSDMSQEDIHLPRTNALVFNLEQGNSLIVRPSGTEPKIKAYVTAVTESEQKANELTDKILKDFKHLIGEK